MQFKSEAFCGILVSASSMIFPMAEELRSEARTLHALIRWATLTGITLLVAKRLTGALFPNLLLSSSWRPEFWWGSFAIEATFELFLLVLLLGVPYCIFRSRHASWSCHRH